MARLKSDFTPEEWAAKLERRKAHYAAHREKVLTQQRIYQRANRDRAREYRKATKTRDDAQRRLREYRMCEAAYRALMAIQGHRCAICQGEISDADARTRYIDHDHATGETRGILCTHCNRGLGGFLDNVEHLKRAIDYLKNPPAKKLGLDLL